MLSFLFTERVGRYLKGMEKESSPEVTETEWYFAIKRTAYEKVAVASGKYLSQKQHIVPVLLLIIFT